MPFIPHTEDDVRKMLAVIGVDSIDDLFDEILDAPAGGREEILARAASEDPELRREAEALRRRYPRPPDRPPFASSGAV